MGKPYICIATIFRLSHKCQTESLFMGVFNKNFFDKSDIFRIMLVCYKVQEKEIYTKTPKIGERSEDGC